MPNTEVKAEGNQFFLCAASSVYPFNLKAGTYTLSHTGKLAFAYYKKRGGSSVLIHVNSVNYGTFTISEDGEYQIWYYITDATASDFTNTQLEFNSTATAYESYSGTQYPITFPAVGKNLFDKNNMTRKDEYAIDQSGVEISSVTSGYFVQYIPVMPNTTYSFSGETRFSIYYYDDDK